MALQQTIVVPQQNESFQGLEAGPCAIVIRSMVMLLQRMLVLPEQNEGFRAQVLIAELPLYISLVPRTGVLPNVDGNNFEPSNKYPLAETFPGIGNLQAAWIVKVVLTHLIPACPQL